MEKDLLKSQFYKEYWSSGLMYYVIEMYSLNIAETELFLRLYENKLSDAKVRIILTRIWRKYMDTGEVTREDIEFLLETYFKKSLIGDISDQEIEGVIAQVILFISDGNEIEPLNALISKPKFIETLNRREILTEKSKDGKRKFRNSDEVVSDLKALSSMMLKKRNRL